MGAMCASGPSNGPDVNPQAKSNGQQLQNVVKIQRNTDKSVKKLLLLGSGNSGKSTFFKQLLQIHGEGFTDKHVFDATKSIFDCVILQMKNVIHQARQFKYELGPETEKWAVYISDLPPNSEVTPQVAQGIKTLWADEQIKEAFHKRTNLGIVDSANYFFDEIDRISQPDYLPSKQDILLVRTPTTGVVRSKFEIEGHKFEIFDVGGQRSERNKWIHCFDTVTAVLFVASLSCFDQGLYEMEHINAMHEALLLFEEIITSRWFRGTSMILFLNKSDLFKIKIQEKDLKICFPEYDGDNSYQSTIAYIKSQFIEKDPKKGQRQIYAHVTCATDESDVIRVFKDVQHIAVQGSLARGGLI